MTEAKTKNYPILIPAGTLFRNNKELILDHYLREYAIVFGGTELINISENARNTIAKRLQRDSSTVQEVIENFQNTLIQLRKFWQRNKIKWSHDTKGLQRKVRIFLYRTYRIAPVFSYKRAKRNLEILHLNLKNRAFWPQISTQLAIVIYVTDKNDLSSNHEKRLLQKNIRTLTNCSAYAFHRTRNKLNIE